MALSASVDKVHAVCNLRVPKIQNPMQNECESAETETEAERRAPNAECRMPNAECRSRSRSRSQMLKPNPEP